MEKRQENIERLKTSLEISHIKTLMIIYTVFLLGFAGFSAVRFHGTSQAGISVRVFGVSWIVIMAIFAIWLYRIFSKAEDYVFCKTTMIKLHRGRVKNTMRFTVELEVPGMGKVTGKTSSIFQTHGWPGPLVEDYVNQSVEIAYNKSTKQIVVIG